MLLIYYKHFLEHANKDYDLEWINGCSDIFTVYDQTKYLDANMYIKTCFWYVILVSYINIGGHILFGLLSIVYFFLDRKVT